MRLQQLAIATAFLVPLETPFSTFGAEYFVSPTTTVQGDGSAIAPFSDLVSAQTQVRRTLRNLEEPEPVTVWLADGVYPLNQTFVFDAEDSGSEGFPVRWQAMPDAKVTLTTSLPSGQISQAETLVAVYDASFLTIRGIRFDSAREQALELAHCFQVEVVDCEVVSSGHTGIHLFGGRNCSLINCSVSDCAQTGIRVEAGERSTLAGSGHAIDKCSVRHSGYHERPLAAAVHLIGVDIQLTNCHVSDCESTGIRLDGNNHLVRGNRVERTCQQTENNGAIYLGQDWTERGNRIEENVIATVGPHPRLDLIAVFLDDLSSGNIVRGNIISGAGRGIAVGGGEANLITGNLVEECIIGIQVDDRGAGWNSGESQLRSHLEAIERVSDSWELYTANYPQLPKNLSEVKFAATGNQVQENLIQGSSRIAFDNHLTVSNNQVSENQIGQGLFTLQLDSNHPMLTLHVPASDAFHNAVSQWTQEALPAGFFISVERE